MSSRHRPPLLLLHLLTLTLTLIFLFSAGDSTHQSQCSALLNLKQSFNSTSKLASWQPGTDCCRWDGVTCGKLSGLVTALDLSNRFITGKISTSSFFNLTTLDKLNLAYNKFDEIPIPSEIGLLANLTSLNLSNAGFVGQIPIGIAKLTNLMVLDLSNFYLNEVGSLELSNPNFESLIGNLSNLRELYLDGVNISANGQQWCAGLAKSTPKLSKLSLVSCSITGPIDSSLLKLSDLSIIRLDENQLNCTVPDFFMKFSSLSEIRLRFCGLYGFFPQNVFLLKKLTVVDLSSNSMLSGSLPEFSHESKLDSLVLSDSKFSGSLPDSIAKLTSLTTMQLSACQFSGVIPSSIGYLNQLAHLDLSMNNFTGPIPPVLPPKIYEIILAHNKLSGSIPSSIGNLRQLVKLDWRNNSLSGHIPASLFTLPSLQVLQLKLNKLSGQLQEFTNGSSRLGIVDLSENRLQGEIPRSVSQLPGLKILTLASNNFSGIMELDRFSALRNLSYLDLSYNKLSIQDKGGNGSVSLPKFWTLMLASCNLTRIPSFLKYQDQMSSLDLSNNLIHGAIPNWIWNIGDGNLQYLNLSCNLFTSVEGPFPNLNLNSSMILDLHSNLLQGPIPLPPTATIILDYSNNNFSSHLPSNISMYLTFTIFFSIANNNITGEVPSSICNAINLQVLDLSYNKLHGQIPSCLLKGSNTLAVLNLEWNQFQGTIPQNIGEGCALRTLNLNGNNLGGQVPQSMAKCSNLEVLDLGNNQIQGSFPFWLAEINSLQVLVLRSNKLYGPIEPSQGIHDKQYTFPKLQIFDISSNHFNGSLPAHCFQNMKAMMVMNLSEVEFKYLQLDHFYYQDTVTVTMKGLVMTLVKTLTIFRSIDFSYNNFEGSIPDVIGELLSLNVLNFSHNALTGNIPLSIGKLVQLESLDFSGNHLSGEIPPTIRALTFLSFLNLSNNYLVGRIPAGNQLSTFSNTSFEGNVGLCGFPLTKQCANPSAHPPAEPSAFVSATEVNWQFVFIGLGFGVGLAVAVGTLMFWETGKKWYNKKVDRMLETVLAPAYSLNCNYFADRRVGAEEGTDSDSSVMEEWHGRKFCVFCTKLEFSQGKVRIHHVECDCPFEEEQY